MIQGNTGNQENHGVISKPASLPCYFYLSMHCERRIILKEIFSYIYKLAGDEAAMLRVALGEAIINALRYGISVRVKINIIGKKLVIRVKDDGPGFDGNAVIQQYLATGGDMFVKDVYEEQGRGIKLMLVWTNQVTYNQKGNEVLLVKQLAGERSRVLQNYKNL